MYELVHSWRSRLLLLKRLLTLRKLSRLSAQVHRRIKLCWLTIFLDRDLLCEVLRSLLHLFAIVVVILVTLRLLNKALRLLSEVLRLLNEALRPILLCRLLILLWAFLRIHGIQLWCRRVLHRHLHLHWGVLRSRHFSVLRLRLSLLHWHGLLLRHGLLGLPLRLLLLILLAIWGHLRAMGEGLLLVHVD